MTETSSVVLHKLKKELEVLESKKGKGTELITLYIPPDKNLNDVMAQMREEYSQASNIKSTRTRKNVLSALEVIMQRLKLIKKVPENGLVLMVGTIPRGIKDKIEVYMIEPPERITTYTYHCDSQFLVEPLKDMLEEKDTYGLLVVDRGEATVGLLKGKRVEVVRRISSNVPRKHGRGGQSQRRFERLIEIAAHEYFKRVAKYASEVFLNTPDLRGVLIGGPGPTKEFFVKEGYLHPEVQKRIIATVDTSYTDDYGIRELVGNASETFKDLEVTKEKNLVQRFMKEVVKDGGLAAYGEKEVKDYLAQGAVDIVLISEDIDSYRIAVACPGCGYEGERTVGDLKGYAEACPRCGEELDVKGYRTTLDELQELADTTGARVEVISNETEEGQQLKAFGGIAAILRFRPGG